MLCTSPKFSWLKSESNIKIYRSRRWLIMLLMLLIAMNDNVWESHDLCSAAPSEVAVIPLLSLVRYYHKCLQITEKLRFDDPVNLSPWYSAVACLDRRFDFESDCGFVFLSFIIFSFGLLRLSLFMVWLFLWCHSFMGWLIITQTRLQIPIAHMSYRVSIMWLLNKPASGLWPADSK